MFGPLQEYLQRFPGLLPYVPLIVVLIRVALLIGAAIVGIRLSTMLITNVFSVKNARFKLDTARAKTLAVLLKSVVRYAVYFFVAITVLETLGVSAASIIAGAGVVGLAVGFGAQSLVRDVLSGFFIILEDQYDVGEYIEAVGVGGVVEEVGLRVTRLRDFSGVLHIVPNGIIDKVSNHNRGPLRAMVDIKVAHEADPEKVKLILEEVVKAVALDTPEVVEGPVVLGIVDIVETGVVFRLWARTQPMQQWYVERVIRRRVKLALDHEGIHTPYPRTVIMPGEQGGIE